MTHLPQFFTKRRVYCKPVTNASEIFGYVNLELTALESFADDRKRYGWRTAVRNLLWLVRHRG